MQSGRGLLAYILAAGFTVSDCKEAHRSGTDATVQAAATNSAESGIHFNLAAYARQRPELAVLAAMAAPGDAFLSLHHRVLRPPFPNGGLLFATLWVAQCAMSRLEVLG